MNGCPDPRGPRVDRADFIAGQIDALEALLRAYQDVEDVLHDARFLELREQLDLTFSGNGTLDQFAAELEGGARDIGTTIRDALQHARWKLARGKGGA